ncbi:hypothetical protein CDD83_7968 [Cordyceps sp. RAO-2017]|nr:hypothetical protein CDD83_7968 [Cordyceps sp. RAO-2017]
MAQGPQQAPPAHFLAIPPLSSSLSSLFFLPSTLLLLLPSHARSSTSPAASTTAATQRPTFETEPPFGVDGGGPLSSRRFTLLADDEPRLSQSYETTDRPPWPPPPPAPLTATSHPDTVFLVLLVLLALFFCFFCILSLFALAYLFARDPPEHFSPFFFSPSPRLGSSAAYTYIRA